MYVIVFRKKGVRAETWRPLQIPSSNEKLPVGLLEFDAAVGITKAMRSVSTEFDYEFVPWFMWLLVNSKTNSVLQPDPLEKFIPRTVCHPDRVSADLLIKGE